MRLRWPLIVARAAEIVSSYVTLVTLRQLFYLLLSDSVIPNTSGAYKGLSRETAKARREGWFPSLLDNTREIHRAEAFGGPQNAIEWLANIYREDRTEGQTHNLYLGAEKSTMLAQLQDWFWDLGVPIVPLRGYSSQTLADDVVDDVADDYRSAVLIYAGDFDASGMDITRDFIERAGCFSEVMRVGVNLDQIDEYGLFVQPGKPDDSRARKFIERYDLEARSGDRVPLLKDKKGRIYRGLIQVEIEALPPEVLRGLYRDAIARYWDMSKFEDVKAQENEHKKLIEGLRIEE